MKVTVVTRRGSALRVTRQYVGRRNLVAQRTFLRRRNDEDRELCRVHARFAEVLNSVFEDREEVVVTRAGHESVVIVWSVEFDSLRETAHLMRAPDNARRLLDAVERLEGGAR